MKKNFTVNISGVLFHIDEDAYKRLNQYMDSLRNHFNNDPGKDEIIADIEIRIAEMLQELTKEKNNIVGLEEIEKVIVAMGHPFEIDGDSEPESDSYNKSKPKRLFRDPDNKIVGGVCSGIAAYFNIDAIWFRLLFVALIFAGGAGLLAYIIFWIAVPEANSTAERLEMKGKQVNIENIEKTVKEEISHLTDKMNEMANHAKDTFKKKNNQGRTPFENLIEAFVKLGSFVARLIAGGFGIIFLLIGFLFLASLGVFLFFQDGIPVDDNMSFSVPHFFELLFASPLSYTLSIIGMTLFIGIPVIGLIFLGIRLLFNVNISAKSIGIPATMIWFGSVFLCALMALIVSKDFRLGSEEERKFVLGNENNHWVLDSSTELSEDMHLHGDEFVIMDWGNTDPSINSYFLGNPDLRLYPTNKEEAYAVITYEARGENVQKAADNVSNIKYDIDIVDDMIQMDRFFHLSSNQKWRAHEVTVRIYLPEGTLISLTDEFVNSRGYWVQGFEDRIRSGREYKMTSEGLEFVNREEDDQE